MVTCGSILLSDTKLSSHLPVCNTGGQLKLLESLVTNHVTKFEGVCISAKLTCQRFKEVKVRRKQC